MDPQPPLLLFLDLAGVFVSAVIGASKAVALDLGYLQAVIVGVITAVRGGTLRVYPVWTALGAAAVCFLIRVLGLRFDLHAPEPPYHHRRRERE